MAHAYRYCLLISKQCTCDLVYSRSSSDFLNFFSWDIISGLFHYYVLSTSIFFLIHNILLKIFLTHNLIFFLTHLKFFLHNVQLIFFFDSQCSTSIVHAQPFQFYFFSLTLSNKSLKTNEIFNEKFTILGFVPAHKAY